MRSIASATTDHGMSTMKNNDFLEEMIVFIAPDKFLIECFQVFVY